MPVAEIQEGKARIAIFNPGETGMHREKELVKQIPGVRWDSAEMLWHVPLSWAACVQLRGIFGAELQIGTALNTWAAAEIQNRITPCLALRTAEDAEPLSLMTRLRPFQRAGAWFLRTAGQALLADEMGLGKTVQAIAAMEALGPEAYPALVVCPNSMKFVWAEEIRRWAPGRLTVVIDGSAADRRKQLEQLAAGEVEVGIINYEGLRKHTRLAPYGSVSLSEDEKTPKELNGIAFKTVVADEVHRAKDPRSKQTRALWAIGDVTEHRFALSGTPVANSPEDIWTLMRFVAPAEYPTKGRSNPPTGFIGRYAQTAYSVYGFEQVIGLKSENKDELFRILDPRFIRRLKTQVLPQLPAKQYTTRPVEMVPKQKKAYEQIRKEMMAELDGGILLATNPLVKLTRMMQFASCYGELQGEDLILTQPSCKVDALLELVDEVGQETALVFAESRQLIEIAMAALVKDGYRAAMITGVIPPHERAERITQFNDRRLQFLLLTLGAGGEGLSFPGCTTGIFLQRSFNFVLNAQAEDRIHGIGRGSEEVATQIIDVITKDTVEERVHTVFMEKAQNLEDIVRDEASLRAWLAR